LFAPDKGLFVANKGLFVTEKGFSIADKGLSVTEKVLFVINKGLFVAKKGLKMTDKGLSVADKGLFVTNKGLKVINKGLSVALFIHLADGFGQLRSHFGRIAGGGCWSFLSPAYRETSGMHESMVQRKANSTLLPLRAVRLGFRRHRADSRAQAGMVVADALRPIYRAGGGHLDFRRQKTFRRAVPIRRASAPAFLPQLPQFKLLLANVPVGLHPMAAGRRKS
jgi:hypothetical protein